METAEGVSDLRRFWGLGVNDENLETDELVTFYLTLPHDSATTIARSGYSNPIDLILQAYSIDQISALMRGMSGKKGKVPKDQRMLPTLTGEAERDRKELLALRENFKKNNSKK